MYYDSVTARFLTEDTYAGQGNDPLSLNLYTYCVNNPIKYDDPSGHSSTPIATGKEDREAWGEAIKSAVKAFWAVVSGAVLGEDASKTKTKKSKADSTGATPCAAPTNTKSTNSVDSKTSTQTSTETNSKEDANPTPGNPPQQGTSTAGAASPNGDNNKNKKDDKKDDKKNENSIQNMQKADDKYLKKNDIDAHDVKYDVLGKKASISKYDIYINKATGELFIFLKGGKGVGIPTGIFIG